MIYPAQMKTQDILQKQDVVDFDRGHTQDIGKTSKMINAIFPDNPAVYITVFT